MFHQPYTLRIHYAVIYENTYVTVVVYPEQYDKIWLGNSNSQPSNIKKKN